jgi:hypothetical protein
MPPTKIPKLPCTHTYLRQTILTHTLPPLYIATSAPSNVSSSQSNILPRLTTHLTHIHAYLGRRQFRSPFLAHNIVLLQHELEKGMSRERREEVEVYVNGMEDPWKKAATELYLARYPGFVMGWDGRLDLGTRELGEEGVKDGGREGGCVVM